ncbi:MAG TPA: MerR family transcriptional regulator [Vicinamibacterales bacterium]|nr:MerR family transcriptional regulator [Vicinamibacterales bacterium]
MSVGTTYSIGELAVAAGVSRRTVRFYVQRGLLPAPEGLGRGARYTDAHLARLLQIKGWQEQGVPLEEVRTRLSGSGRRAGKRAPQAPLSLERRDAGEPAQGQAWEAAATPEAPGTAWFRQPLVAGYELHVAAGRRPLTAHQLARLARALGDIVDKGGEGE